MCEQQSIDKELALTQITEIMTANGISLDELPGVRGYVKTFKDEHDKLTSKIQTLCATIKSSYGKLIECIGDEDAWEWVEYNVSEYWRTYIGLEKPHRYKVVEIKVSASLCVPNDFEEDQVLGYIDNQLPELGIYDMSCVDYRELDTDLTLEKAERRHDYVNDLSDFYEG